MLDTIDPPTPVNNPKPVDVWDAAPEQQDGIDDYREFHRGAAISAAFVLASLLAVLMFSPWLLLVPLFGCVIGAIAWRQIVAEPDVYTGAWLAQAGTTLCGLLLVGGGAWQAIDYVTEVPEGYDRRLGFAELQPDPDHPESPIPPAALELDGEKVFIKGYVYPDGQLRGIKQFILVPDRGTCCFGGQPKLTDMIQVTLQDGQTIEYSYFERKLAGVLHVDQQRTIVPGLDGVFYRLDAEYVR